MNSPGLGSWPHHRHLPESAKASQKRRTWPTVPSLSRAAVADGPQETTFFPRLSVSHLPYLSDHLRPQAPLLVHIWQTCLSQTCVVNKVICQFPSISNLISVMNAALSFLTAFSASWWVGSYETLRSTGPTTSLWGQTANFSRLSSRMKTCQEAQQREVRGPLLARHGRINGPNM